MNSFRPQYTLPLVALVLLAGYGEASIAASKEPATAAARATDSTTTQPTDGLQLGISDGIRFADGSYVESSDRLLVINRPVTLSVVLPGSDDLTTAKLFLSDNTENTPPREVAGSREGETWRFQVVFSTPGDKSISFSATRSDTTVYGSALDIDVSTGTVKITRLGKELTPDANKNGQIDALVLRFELRAHIPGRYSIQGELRAANGYLKGSTQTFVKITKPGVTVVKLSFDGFAFRESPTSNGVYSIENIGVKRLAADQTTGLDITEAWSAKVGHTARYKASRFERARPPITTTTKS